MRHIQRLLAILLLALWGPATLHCALEAAGVLGTQCAEDCGREIGREDSCDLVESGLYKNSTPLLKIAAPELLRLAFLFVPAADLAPAPELSAPDAAAEPRALHRAWQFTQRAAPPCRAPSLAS